MSLEPTLRIDFKLTGYNQQQEKARTNRYMAARDKANEQSLIEWRILEQHVRAVAEPVVVHCLWHEGKNRGKHRDPDNIASAKKVILDALVSSGIIKDDRYPHVVGFEDAFCFGDDSKYGVDVWLFGKDD